MSWLITMWCLSAAISVVLSATLMVFRRRFSLKHWERNLNVRTETGDPSAVTVVIAARNEQHAVERTLREFSALPGIQEVILVDDASDDHTLQIARSVASCIPSIRVLEAPPLPSGWIGKTHAIHWASQFAASDFILFTDADVHLHQLPLQDIVSRMDTDALDHVGGNFRLELPSLSDAMVGPVFAAIAFVALGFFASRGGAATGAFNLVRTSAYRRLNGHSTIRGHVVDDVALARRCKSLGLRSRFLDVSPAVSVRLFEGFRGFAFAISRWSVLFSRSSAYLALILSLCGVALYSSLVLRTLALLVDPAVWSSIYAFHGLTPAGIIVGTYLLSVLPFVLAGWLHSRSRWWGLLSPIGLVIMTVAVTVSAIRRLLGMKVRWRGRSYPHSACSGTSDNPEGGS